MSTIEERPIGFGRLRRREDARFIGGEGLHGDDACRVWDAMRGRAEAPR